MEQKAEKQTEKHVTKKQDEPDSMKKIKHKPGEHSAESTLLKIAKWRETNEAPVDIYGAEKAVDKNLDPEIQKYQVLVSIILSARTKDEISSKVVQKLRKQIDFTPKTMASLSEDAIYSLIRQVNFNRRKAKSIKEVSSIITEKGLPKTKQQLLKLPGVGLKVGTMYQKVAEGKQDGIGVDSHIHRIGNRLGWISTSTPDETQLQLQKIFPKQLWGTINRAISGFGQLLCLPKQPKCEQCPVSKKCPSSCQKNIEF